MDRIAEIRRALESDTTIPRDQVVEWIGTDDLEVWGLLYRLTDTAYSRIEPELGMETTCQFLLDYYLACVTQNAGHAKGAHGRFQAARELVAWLEHLWKRRPATQNVIDSLIGRMTEAYLTGDDELRNCIETGFLEHVFELETLVPLFEHWRSDPELAAAHARCLEWGTAHSRD